MEKVSRSPRWKNYRRRERWAASLFLGVVASLLLGKMVHSFSRSVAFGLGCLNVLCIGGFAFVWPRFVSSQCPCCGQRLHVNRFLKMTSGRKCPHCGVERYSPV